MKWTIAALALSLALAGGALAATGSPRTDGLLADQPAGGRISDRFDRLAQRRPGWETRSFEPGSHHYERVYGKHHHHHHHHATPTTQRPK